MFSTPAAAPAAIAGKGARPPGRSTPYLFTHRNSPAFRIRIPTDIQACLGKKEYRRSLGRCYAAEAKLRALRLATAALEVFSFAREALANRRALQAKSKLLTPGIIVRKKSERHGGTSPHEKTKERLVNQEHSTNQNEYTNTPEGRPLSELADEDIRREWLYDLCVQDTWPCFFAVTAITHCVVSMSQETGSGFLFHAVLVAP